MNEGTLADVYRPVEFKEIWGNQETIRTLETNLAKPNHAKTYLFSGMRGCGKTTTARILASMVGASEVKNLNVASVRNIDDARTIIEEVKYSPVLGGKVVYILDEVHAANSTWEDAMLTTLEEPPSWVYFVLCSTDPAKIKKTIRSRCESYLFEPLSVRVMVPKLKQIADSIVDEYKINNPDDLVIHAPRFILDETLITICEVTEGIPREALILLGQVLDADPDDRQALLVSPIKDAETIELCRALMNKQPIGSVMGILQNNKKDPESIRRAVIGYLAAIMTKSPGTSNGNRAANLFGDFIEPLYNTGRPGLVYQVYSAMSRG